jgi:hypothetical protein
MPFHSSEVDPAMKRPWCSPPSFLYLWAKHFESCGGAERDRNLEARRLSEPGVSAMADDYQQKDHNNRLLWENSWDNL